MEPDSIEGERMAGGEEAVRRKAAALFAELVGERASRLDASRPGREAATAVTEALAAEYGPERAADIGFHLADWGADAAFVVALHLFPERFTAEEIREGVQACLSHVPNHLAAAAHLAGWPLRDVFGVGLEFDD